jgi:type VI secretion system protein ImpC
VRARRGRPDLFEADRDAAAVSERLGAQLPYIFLISRLAHYLKCVQRERIGSWLDRSELERELGLWLRQYVSAMEDVQLEVRARRPLRSASVTVEAIDGQTGWYRCRLQIQPHISHNSAAFTLSLVGRLDRPNSESRG